MSLLASLCALTAALALSTAPALAARGHVFSTTFGTEGEGAGQLKEPMGVAVEEAGPNAGDVYVADFGNNRVQWFSYNAGENKYEVAGEVKAATGTGTGTLTVGSQTIESVASGKGAFVVGQSISGAAVGGEPRIPAETTVTAVNPVAGTIEINKAVEGKAGAVETLVPLSAEQPLFKPRAVAVDNSTGGESSGDVYVSTEVNSGEPSEHSVVDKFTASGEFVGQIARTIPEAPAFEFVSGVAVDPAGGLWVMEGSELFDRFNGAVANGFERSCQGPKGFAGALFGMAVDAHDNLYVQTNLQVARGYGGVVELDSQCKVINNALDTESDPSAAGAGVTFFGVAVDSTSGEAYVDNVESVGRFAASGGHEVEVERFGTGHLAGEGCNRFVRVTCLGGLAVNGATAGPTGGDVYAAVGSPARIVVFTPEEPAAPTVEGESVVKLTDNSVTLEAEIDPRSLPADKVTKYYFKYGACPAPPATCEKSGYPSETPVGSLSPSFDVETVGAPLEGLLPGTTYHFKVVTENKRGGPVLGAERVFTMRNTGEFVLADGRGWEMVSPAAMHGALILPLGEGSGSTGATTQAAAGGGALAYAANAPTESKPAGSASSPEVLSTRGAGGWSSQNVVVPHAVSTGVVSIALEVPFFSEDLSLAAVQPLGSFVALSEAASEQTAYLRDNTAGAYTPLVTGCPAAPTSCKPAIEEHADIPPGTIFGQQSTSLGNPPCPPVKASCGAVFVGGTPDLGHVILTAVAPLKPGANAHALYEWSAGAPASEQLQLVSLLPSEKSGEELPAVGPQLGFYNAGLDQRGAVSADGSRVFFTSESHLYMRDTVAHKTIQIDLPEQGCLKEETCGGGFVEAEFQFASTDGSRVFFKDTQKLTAGAGQYGVNGFGADLYVCEIREDVCVLTDLAPSGVVMGEVMGVSEDGSWVYFAANGALAPGAVSGACPNGAASAKPSPSASCDLYVEHYAAGVWGKPRVVVEVSAADQFDWGADLTKLVARVSPDGRWLAFMSQRSLTGYDNRDALSGRPDQEVYLYDAEHNRLTCASCDPSGARPQGVEYGNGSSVPLLGNAGWDEHTWLAGSIPAWVQYSEHHAIYQPRYLSDSGRLFFDSHDALVPKDVNGTGDVYEYEPVGVGGCSSSADSGGVVFKPGGEVASGVVEGEGCVGLMSSGSSSEESAFLDASENGGDVFFISTARLSPLDTEGGRTVYDAHECTTVSPCIAPPPASPPACTTEASCLAAPSPQPSTFGPSGSATFSGPGNLAPPPSASVKVKTVAQLRAERLVRALRACHRIRKRSKRAKCEKQARRRYAVKASTNAKRAGNYRRAGR